MPVCPLPKVTDSALCTCTWTSDLEVDFRSFRRLRIPHSPQCLVRQGLHVCTSLSRVIAHPAATAHCLTRVRVQEILIASGDDLGSYPHRIPASVKDRLRVCTIGLRAYTHEIPRWFGEDSDQQFPTD